MAPLTGIVVLDKPPGLTSRRALDRVARLVKPAKAGHAGTLDPLATGVLVVCIGRATKLIEYVQAQPKRYRATFRLGVTSDTEDATGVVTPLASPPIPTLEAIARAAASLRGEIMQRPSAFSALKVEGRRAYDLARKGHSVELAARPVTVYELQIFAYEYPEVRLEVLCSGGTYVRALGRDLAEAVGTGAIMTALERTAVGPFTLDGACRPDALTHETLGQHIRPALAAIGHLPRRQLDADELEEVAHGRPLILPDAGASNDMAGLNEEGQLVAILRLRDGAWYPSPNLIGKN